MNINNDKIIKNFINNLSTEGKSFVSIKNYKSDITHFIGWVILKLKTIGVYANTFSEAVPFLTNELSSEYKEFLTTNNIKVKTINRRLSSLRSLSKYLVSSQIVNNDFVTNLQNVSLTLSPTTASSQGSTDLVVDNYKNFLVKDASVSFSTVKNYISDIKHFISWCQAIGINSKNLNKITSNHIKEYRSEILKNASSVTLDRKLSSLRKFFDWMGLDNKIDISPIEVKVARAEKDKKTKTTGYNNFQARIIAKFAEKPKAQNFFYHLFYTRPEWYKNYQSLPLANYFNLAILVILMSALGVGAYNQFFKTTATPLAFPTALTRPSRYLSFQGRLTNQYGNPTTAATNIVFKLYDAASSGTVLWNSGTCSITPDTDGIFSTLLGSSCGAEIASTVFSENASVWLGVTAGADAEATPRVQIATVAYALNTETLQGYPASASATANTVPVINNSGYLVIGASSPKLQSTSGTFAIEGQALTVTTPNTSNGSITINPDGTGTLNLTFEGAAPGGSAKGFVNATNANITSGALYYGEVASDAAGYNLLQLASGSTPRAKFTIDSAGNATSSGTINGLAVSGGTISTGVWNGTAIGTQYGGTGQNWSATAQGSLPYFNGTGTMAALAPTTAGYILTTQGAGANPSWTAASGVGTNYWQLANHVLAPANAADYDLAVGGNSTASAKFQVLASNGNITTSGTASVSGNLTLGNGSAIQSAFGPLTLNYKSGANAYTAGLTLTNSGYVGIGTADPTKTLDVNGDINIATGKAYYINGTSVLNGTTLGTNVVTSSLTTVGALASGSIASGFGTIATSNTITGTTLNGTTGINTGATAGTQRIDASGNLVNIANITASGYATMSASLALGNTSAVAGPGHLNMSGNLTALGTINGLVVSSGTISTGTWNGTAIGTQYGGTGQNWSSIAQGNIPYFDGTGTMNTLAPTTAGYLLTTQGAGANPTWVDPTTVGTNYWQLANHVLAPANAADYDLAVGGNSTASAKFQVLAGSGNITTSGTASVSGNLTLGNGSAIQSAFGPLTLNYKSGANAYTAGLTLTNSGSVGLQTATPLAALHVNSTLTTSGAASFNEILFDTTSFAAGVGGGIAFGGKYNTGGSQTYFGSLQGIKENATDGNYAGALLFTTRANGSSPTESMRITSAGSVGIGTTNPLAKLNIAGVNQSVSSRGNVFVSTTNAFGADLGGQTTFGGNWATGGNPVPFAGIAGRKTNSTDGDAGGYLTLMATNPAGGSLTEYMRITGAGKVGIGTTAPSTKLDVNGNFNLTGYATMSASLAVGNVNAVVGPGNINASGTIAGVAVTQNGNTVCDTSGNCSSVGNFWQLNNHVISPSNYADYDLAVGGNSTASAKFQVLAGSGNITTSGTASVSGNLTLGNGSAIQSAYGPVTLKYKAGADTYSPGLTLTNSGFVGIGRTSPGAPLETYRSGNLNVARFTQNNTTTDPSTVTSIVTLDNSDTTAGNYSILGFTQNTAGMARIGSKNVDSTHGEFILQVRNGGSFTDALYVKSDGSVGIGTTAPTAKLDVNGNFNLTGYATMSASLALGNTSAVAGPGHLNMSGSLGVGNYLNIGGTTTTTYSRFGTGTTGHSLSGADALLVGGSLELDGVFYLDSGTLSNSAGTASLTLTSTPTTGFNALSASSWLVENTANLGQAALMINQQKGGPIFSASASGVTKFVISNGGSASASGNITMGGQLQVGRFASAPTGGDILGAGSVYFNTATKASNGTTTGDLFLYGTDNAYHRVALDMTQYSSTSANIANGSFIQIAHNQATNDLAATGWVYDTISSLWKNISEFSHTIKNALSTDWNNNAPGEVIRSTVKLTDVELSQSVNPGTGADGAITVSSNTNINTTSLITGRSCADGGDAVNYSVSSLTTTTATLSSTPASGCLASGDEVLLINLQGITSSYDNVGNYETLRILNISTNVITFTAPKAKYYGNTTTDDSNIGTTAGTNQLVMLQRVPNYSNVTVNTSSSFTPSAWNGTKGGVMFFRATGTVTVGSGSSINATALGYRGGNGGPGARNPGGYLGESYNYSGVTNTSGGGTSTNATLNGGRAAGKATGSPADGSITGGGGGGGAPGYNDGDESGGGGGGGGHAGGGGGGGGGSWVSSGAAAGSGGAVGVNGGGGGGAGAGSTGAGGNAGSAGGTATGTGGAAGSGATAASGGGGGNSTVDMGGAGGGGGGYYGNSTLTQIQFGSGGGGGAPLSDGTTGEAGGAGGGIVYISANTISNSGTIGSTGGVGAQASNGGDGGSGAGGSIELLANTVTLGTTTALGGAATTTSGGGRGGGGGDGIIAVYVVTSSSGSSTPTATVTSLPYYPYGVYHSPAIATMNAVSLDKLSWNGNRGTYGNIEFQTRSGPDKTLSEITPDANTIGLWHMNETANGTCAGGGDACDSSGNGNNATASGTLIETTNKVLGAAARNFSPHGSYLDVGDVAAVDSTSSLSFCSWVYSTSNKDQAIMSKTTSGAADGVLFIRDQVGSATGRTNTYKIFVADSNSANLAQIEGATNAAHVNAWDHVCFTYTAGSATGLRLYINGVEDPNSPVSTASISGIDAGTNRLYIGNYGSSDIPFEGIMDEAYLTNDVRTAAEINNDSKFWEAWKPAMSDSTTALILQDANTHTDWQNAYTMTVADGDIVRYVPMFEDENEGTVGNTTKFTASASAQYAQASISAANLTNYDYLTAWVYATASGSTVKLGFGESAATEQEETVTIDAANKWQKVYWDLNDIPLTSRDAVTKLRVTSLASGWNTIYIDNVRAEKLMTNTTGTQITSTPNNFIQYRSILSTTNTSYLPILNGVNITYNDGYKIVQADTNNVKLYNYSGSTQQLRLDTTVFGADLAEWYTVDDPAISAGDTVSLTGKMDSDGVPILRLAKGVNDPNLIGIISTKAGQTLGIEKADRRLLALAGRVPVKVDPNSPAISAGDGITSSTKPGFAKKANFGDIVIARAAQSWNREGDTIFVIVGGGGSATYLTSLDDYRVVKDSITNAWGLARNTTEEAVNTAAAFGNLIAGNVKAGAIITEEFTTNSFTAFQGTVDNLLIKSGLVASNVQVKLISPLANATDVTVQIGSATESGKFIVQNTNGQEVASIDSVGNASFSGTLIANEIKSKSLDEIKAELAKVTVDQNLLKEAANWSLQTATNSANLNQLALVDLFVTNQAAINSLSITKNIAIGTDLVISSQNTINSLTNPLQIQSLAMAPVEIMAGLVKIDTSGNVQIMGNLFVAGKIESKGLDIKNSEENVVASINASGSAEFNSVLTQNLVIAGAVDEATSSAAVDGIINTNATAGTAIINSGVSEITIKNPKVTDYTLIYVTPTSTTENNVLYVKSKKSGEFTVGFANPINVDVNFNWWIIQVK